MRSRCCLALCRKSSGVCSGQHSSELYFGQPEVPLASLAKSDGDNFWWHLILYWPRPGQWLKTDVRFASEFLKKKPAMVECPELTCWPIVVEPNVRWTPISYPSLKRTAKPLLLTVYVFGSMTSSWWSHIQLEVRSHSCPQSSFWRWSLFFFFWLWSRFTYSCRACRLECVLPCPLGCCWHQDRLQSGEMLMTADSYQQFSALTSHVGGAPFVFSLTRSFL